jgi:uncharacterized protein (TIGR04255 family)
MSKNTTPGSQPQPLPGFDRPPLDEMVIVVQFEPLKHFSAAHMGLFWQKVRDRYPLIEDNPPLLHQVELSEPTPGGGSTILRVPLALRCWFLSQDRTQLVQMQRDQFIRNWRRVQGNEDYPRYESLIAAFKREWREFVAFVADQKLGEIKIDQCELSYINQIPKGEGWESFAEIGKVFRVFRPANPTGLLVSPEAISWNGQYKLPDGRGRFYAELSPGFRGRDFQFVLTMSLKARGTPEGQSEDQVFAWFDLAHEWIVRGFDELTDPNMHAIWRRRP